MKTKYLNFIIIVLFIALISVAGWLFYSSKNKKTITKTNTPNIEITQAAEDYAASIPVLSSKAIEIRKSLTKTDKKVGDLILENNDNFTVIYLINNDKFVVDINKNPFSDNKTKAEDWFKSKGFSSDDLCLLRIFFGAKSELNLSLTKNDFVPTGCTP